MKPIHTQLTNRILGAPKNWDVSKDGPCVGLPIYATDDPYMYSWWKPTWRERISMLLGRRVQLCVVGTAHPPVAIDVESGKGAASRGVGLR